MSPIPSLHQIAVFARGWIHCRRSGSFSHAISSHPPTSTMTSTSQPTRGRDVVLPTLDVFIQVLNIAKDACGIPPAQVALGSASSLLTMIQVRFPLLRWEDQPPAHVSLGHDGELSGLCRPWAELRECVSSTRPEIEGEAVGPAQRGRPRCDWRSDNVSQNSDVHDERSTY